ncbi:hypothetical protein POM88_048360 [Heracleum sosnowskyi]|uniref:Uncharacterized protein n=1 Tax=Heracleum sosnowskyi TaxID=360622 RepID=A0AAD8GV68_9APIA|nr:hypothetical protein POM88_048360 [Heracleum sosnowskyi]
MIMVDDAMGGILKLRHGVRAASRSTLIGGTSLDLLEGLGILVDRYPLDKPSKGKHVAGSPGFRIKEPEATPFSKLSVARIYVICFLLKLYLISLNVLTKQTNELI